MAPIQSKLVIPLTCLAVGSAFAPAPAFSRSRTALSATATKSLVCARHGPNCPCCASAKANHGPNCACCTGKKRSGCVCMVPGACSVGCACVCHTA